MKTSSLGSTRSDKGSESRRGSSTCASHGELVWDQIEAGSEPGHEIKDYVDRGEPVADNTIVDLARTHLQAAGAWILDDFPRTMAQARTPDEELEKHGISLKKLIERIAGGSRARPPAGCTTRCTILPPDPQESMDPEPLVQCEDDTEEALRRQLKGYRKEAETIKEHYDKQGSPSSVMDPDQNPSRVIEDILEALGRPERSP